MSWQKLENGEVSLTYTTNDFRILPQDEKDLILASNPVKLLDDTFKMLESGYSKGLNREIQEGIIRLEGLMQLGFIQTNSLKIRTLLSLYFAYTFFGNSKSGRFRSYTDWDNFGSHCQKSFPDVSNFKGKTITSPFNIPSLNNEMLNRARDLAELKGLASPEDYKYFEDDGAIDLTSRLEGIDETPKDSFSRTVTTLSMIAVIVGFFMPYYNGFNLESIQIESGLDVIKLLISFITDSAPVGIELGFYSILLLTLPVLLTWAGLKTFKSLLSTSEKEISVEGFSDWAFFLPLIIWGILWYQSGSFGEIFSLLRYGFYISFVGALLARISSD